MSSLTYERSGMSLDGLRTPSGGGRASRTVLEGRAREASGRLSDQWQNGEHAFIDLPDEMKGMSGEWNQMMPGSDDDHIVVLGIGGSSLGTKAIAEACDVDGLTVSESIDPRSIRRLLDRTDWSNTTVLAVSKSGTTVETVAQLSAVYDALRGQLGEEEANRRLGVITGRGTPLWEFSQRKDLPHFRVPKGVGGRFSVLSAVGLVPLGAAGLDTELLLEGAGAVRDRWQEHSGDHLSAVTSAAADVFGLEWAGASELVMLSYVDRAASLVDWFRQLLAESLGKRKNRQGEVVRAGLTPIKAAGPVDQHSQIQLYVEGEPRRGIMLLSEREPAHNVDIGPASELSDQFDFLEGRSFSELRRAERRGTEQALRENGVPTAEWSFRRITPRTVGAFMMTWELITAVVGEMLDVDAFNQPGVERGKVLARQYLGSPPGNNDADELVVID